MTTDDAHLIRRDLARYHTEIREHIAACQSCRAMTLAHEHDINGRPGNGHNPGLKTRVKSSEDALDDMLDESKKRHARIMAGLWTLATGLILAIATTLISLAFGG